MVATSCSLGLQSAVSINGDSSESWKYCKKSKELLTRQWTVADVCKSSSRNWLGKWLRGSELLFQLAKIQSSCCLV